MRVTFTVDVEYDRYDTGAKWTAVATHDKDARGSICAGQGSDLSEALGNYLHSEAAELLKVPDIAGELQRLKSMHESASERLGNMTTRYEEARLCAVELRKKVDAQAVLLCPGKAVE